MLENLARHLELNSKPRRVVHEAVALGNAMIALAQNRCFAFHSVGALGAIEMTAPTRAGHVARGLKRLGVPAAKLHYFALHAVLDVKACDRVESRGAAYVGRRRSTSRASHCEAH